MSKRSRQGASSSSSKQHDRNSRSADRIDDPRFSRIQTDPLFRLPSRKTTHVTIDKRFAHMLRDERFSSKARVDRYGRRLAANGSEDGGKGKGKAKGKNKETHRQGGEPLKELSRLYRVEDESWESRGARKSRKSNKGGDEARRLEIASASSSEIEGDKGQEEKEEEEEEEGDSIDDDDDEIQKELERINVDDYDPARQGGFSESSSEEDSSSGEDDVIRGEGDDDEELEFPERNDPTVPEGEVSSRIAVVNLDWDNIRAVDLLAVFSSFASQGGSILDVTVYPSEFGKERMEREAQEGPPREVFATKGRDDDKIDGKQPNEDGGASSPSKNEGDEVDGEDDDDDDERIKKSLLKEDKGEEFNSTKLRRYQLERLRYYYAVLTCSSAACAKAIYDAVDGTEYLSTANVFDLRFVPDNMDFSSDRPRDSAQRIPSKYRPSDFVTDALQHSKVKLTWDADDAERKGVQKKAFSGSRKEISENDLKAYLGSDSSEDEREGEGEDEGMDGGRGSGGERKGQPTSISYLGIDSIVEPKKSNKASERKRMRELLGLGEEPESASKPSSGPVGDMQVTFSAGLSDEKDGGVFENAPPEQEETTVQKYVRKEKERKVRRKEKLKASRQGVQSWKDPHGETSEAASNDNGDDGDNGNEHEDLGFDDPFFDAPEKDEARRKANDRRLKKEKNKKERAGNDEEQLTAEQRRKLEALMGNGDDDDDDDDDKIGRGQLSSSIVAGGAGAGGKVQHFDMKQIEKAEKARNKKGKARKKLSASQREALAATEGDDFDVDLADPRFEAVFSRSEYALDPSHPKFKATRGMKSLLEEGRRKSLKKRKREQDDDGGDE